MYTYAFIGSKRISLDPSQAIGKGGEADIYRIDTDTAVKIFKPPDHPDLSGDPDEQRKARDRILTHQKKLRLFPKNLPVRVVAPLDLVTDGTTQVIGYAMRFLPNSEVIWRYRDPPYGRSIPRGSIVPVFLDVHQTVKGIHEAKVVIGDFNDLNILVHDHTEANFVDADSYQFGPFLCLTYTARFVDPLLCDPTKGSPELVKPYNPNSDWYAFCVMLMQSLLFVDPYGGTYASKDPSKRVKHDARPLHRITVFHPQVNYPKPAIPYGVLSDDLLQLFHLVFEKDERGEFPVKLLQEMRWTKCTSCGTEHARPVCPVCSLAAPIAVKETTVIRGKVVATRIFRTPGEIVFAAVQEGKLKWLYYEDGQLKRESNLSVARLELDPRMRFRIRGENSLVGLNNRVFTSGLSDQLAVDSFGSLPMFDSNEKYRYWTQGGSLFRDGLFGPEYIGNVLSGQTLFWVGPKFGFGFYRAGAICVGFVFDAEQKGINDSVKLPTIRGQLIDSTCVFSRDKCWFLWSVREAGRTVNHCAVITANGTVEATVSADEGDGSWLGTLRGKCAVGALLFAATDEGIVRVEVNKDQITKTREFPDTEPFVDTGDHLFPSADGLYVVRRREIYRLTINP